MPILRIEVHNQQALRQIKELESTQNLTIVDTTEPLISIPDWQKVLVMERKKQAEASQEQLLNWDDVKNSIYSACLQRSSTSKFLPQLRRITNKPRPTIKIFKKAWVFDLQ